MLLSVCQFMARCSGSAGGTVFAKANTLEICEEYIWNACVMPSTNSDLVNGSWNFKTIWGCLSFPAC